MKWLLIVWTLGGPNVAAVLSDREACYGLLNETVVKKNSAVRFCAELNLDTVTHDVVLWEPELEQLRTIKQ